MARNYDNNDARTPSFFDGTTYFYGWKNSEAVADKDFKVLWNDLKIGNFTAGSVMFAGSDGLLNEDNALLFYDETLKTLGVGTNTPTARIESKGVGATVATVNINARNSVNTELFKVFDNGQINLGGQSVNLNFGSTSNVLLNQFGRATLRSIDFNSCRLSTALDFNNLQANNVKSINLGTALSPTGGNATLNLFNNGVGGVLADAAQIFGLDIVAGNTAPVVKTENGDLIKIYSIGGWGDPSGTATRATFDTTTVTLSELAERVKALIDDFKTFGNLKS